MKKKQCAILTAVLLMLVMLTGCGSKDDGGFGLDTAITVVTREEGSGTRDAFVELTGVMVKDANGNKNDRTTEEAIVIDGTQAVMSNVVGNPYAIGYISLGSLNETVKALAIDGVRPTTETVKSGEYVIARPFNIAYKAQLSDVAQDFIDYIMSTDGQAVVEASGYVAVAQNEAYSGVKPSGKIVVSGSSSVSPVMEKLKEAYEAINPNATIEIQTTDSSAGLTAATEGTCDIGMASRDLKDSEKASLISTTFAMDGIAVIVNIRNTVSDLTAEQVAKIFTGEALTWSDAAA